MSPRTCQGYPPCRRLRRTAPNHGIVGVGYPPCRRLRSPCVRRARRRRRYPPCRRLRREGTAEGGFFPCYPPCRRFRSSRHRTKSQRARYLLRRWFRIFKDSSYVRPPGRRIEQKLCLLKINCMGFRSIHVFPQDTGRGVLFRILPFPHRDVLPSRRGPR